MTNILPEENLAIQRTGRGRTINRNGTRQDTATRRATTAIVGAVGLFAGSDSYVHIYDLARAHQQSALSAAFLPLAGDGVVVASSWVMLAAASRGKKTPARARCWFWGGSRHDRRQRSPTASPTA